MINLGVSSLHRSLPFIKLNADFFLWLVWNKHRSYLVLCNSSKWLFYPVKNVYLFHIVNKQNFKSGSHSLDIRSLPSKSSLLFWHSILLLILLSMFIINEQYIDSFCLVPQCAMVFIFLHKVNINLSQNELQSSSGGGGGGRVEGRGRGWSCDLTWSQFFK